MHYGDVCIVYCLRVLAQSFAGYLHSVVFIHGEVGRSFNISGAQPTVSVEEYVAHHRCLIESVRGIW